MTDRHACRACDATGRAPLHHELQRTLDACRMLASMGQQVDAISVREFLISRGHDMRARQTAINNRLVELGRIGFLAKGERVGRRVTYALVDFDTAKITGIAAIQQLTDLVNAADRASGKAERDELEDARRSIALYEHWLSVAQDSIDIGNAWKAAGAPTQSELHTRLRKSHDATYAARDASCAARRRYLDRWGEQVERVRAEFDAKRGENHPRSRIVAAAIRVEGEVWSLPPPARHCHLVHAWCAAHFRDGESAKLRGEEQGFVTTGRAFVGRRDAAVIAFAAGQIEAEKAELYSEDLW